MAWIKMKGVIGLVYEPDFKRPGLKKHKCPDCTGCMMCPEERCRVCLKQKACGNLKGLRKVKKVKKGRG